MLIAVLATALVVLLGGLVWLVLKARADYVPRDQATLCPLSGYTSQTLVLIDTTDAFAPVTQTQVLNKLRDVVTAIPKDGLLELQLLGADAARTRPAMPPLCNPGDGGDIDPITGNPELAKRRWQMQYAEKVEEALRSGVAGSTQDYSPIMEAIQQIAAEHLTSQHDRSIPSRLVVVSDMIQHTAGYSHYVDGLSSEAFAAKARNRLATDLAGAEVEFWMVRRPTQKVDAEQLGNFWLEWASNSNAKRPVTLSPLMGM
ncbi:hypothetical protein [Devosia sp. A16]|uniref:hypothetical protein n=1 Tax=Devosia sp. A16 TaxID=1736675 RepID=UPI0006D7EE0D|nr:hypothetical protein [Devosia sp. A16]